MPASKKGAVHGASERVGVRYHCTWIVEGLFSEGAALISAFDSLIQLR